MNLKQYYQTWLKNTNRSGGVLVGSSVREFIDYLETQITYKEKEIVMSKKKLVILTGAGMSAESGIPTFRDADGLWEGHDVMEVASPEGWDANPELVLKFYNQRRAQLKTVEPNAGHIFLAKMEEDFDVTIITQNVDDLHERAGSTKVVHLHGELTKKRSVEGTTLYPYDEDIKVGDLAPDGHQFRPHIVWFGEDVPFIYTAADIVNQADIFVVVGTSLQVYPAAGLLNKVPTHAERFVIDVKKPTQTYGYEYIQKGACDGIAELITKLKS